MAEEEKKGQVRDLVKKLERGEITSKDALKELEKRGLLEPERYELPKCQQVSRVIRWQAKHRLQSLERRLTVVE